MQQCNTRGSRVYTYYYGADGLATSPIAATRPSWIGLARKRKRLDVVSLHLAFSTHTSAQRLRSFGGDHPSAHPSASLHLGRQRTASCYRASMMGFAGSGRSPIHGAEAGCSVWVCEAGGIPPTIITGVWRNPSRSPTRSDTRSDRSKSTMVTVRRTQVYLPVPTKLRKKNMHVRPTLNGRVSRCFRKPGIGIRENWFPMGSHDQDRRSLPFHRRRK